MDQSDGRTGGANGKVMDHKMSTGTESTPLLGKVDDPGEATTKYGRSVIFKVLFTSFIMALSFGVTQVPLIYIFGVMTCDEYYKTHIDTGLPGRCKVPEIESSTALSIALLGASTTIFGVFNLFWTGWCIKRFGIKSALLTSCLWPAVRLAIQNVGVQAGAGLGIIIVQMSQIITIIGGPAGYFLALNSYATEIVSPAEKTIVLGRVQGVAFFGTSLGYLGGGLLMDVISNLAPFRVTLALFCISTTYVFFFLPKLPHNMTPAQLKKTASISAFFEPLLMFIPRKWVLRDGRTRKEYGILLLGAGAFFAVLATGYIPVLLQMFATDVLDFGATENGYLISLNSFVRGIFLTFIFPLIIQNGRKWFASRSTPSSSPTITTTTTKPAESEPPSLPTAPEEFEPGPIEGETASEPIQTTHQTAIPPENNNNNTKTSPPDPAHSSSTSDSTSFQFDLLYTRYSILIDAILTSLAAFAHAPWHLFLIAIILPFASGTGSAAKGTILAMCSPDQRSDALSAISLVEVAARLITTGLFGYVFAAFALLGKPGLTFLANGAVAAVSFAVLLATRFPPDGARRVLDDGGDEEGVGESESGNAAERRVV